MHAVKYNMKNAPNLTLRSDLESTNISSTSILDKMSNATWLMPHEFKAKVEMKMMDAIELSKTPYEKRLTLMEMRTWVQFFVFTLEWLLFFH